LGGKEIFKAVSEIYLYRQTLGERLRLDHRRSPKVKGLEGDGEKYFSERRMRAIPHLKGVRVKLA